jgi:hypothetical protein
MKTASLGLLEVIVVRAYAGGRWLTVTPCFAVELRILLSSIFGKKNPYRFVIFGVSQSSRTKKSCSRGSTPHKVGEEKGKDPRRHGKFGKD